MARKAHPLIDPRTTVGDWVSRKMGASLPAEYQRQIAELQRTARTPRLTELVDTALTETIDGQVPTYDAITRRWSAATPSTRGADPDAWAKRQMQLLKDAGATTYTNQGFPAAPTIGTTTNVDDADGPFGRQATTASSGNASGIISAFTVCRRDWEPEFLAVVKTDATITSVRHWAGLWNNSPDAKSSLIAGDHYMAFRYATDLDGTAFWRCVSNDGGGSGFPGSETVTTVAVTASTAYRLLIVCSTEAGAEFYIDGTLVATHPADLPSAATLLGYGVRTTTLSAAIRATSVNRLMMRHN